jgi:hypothetical protein
MPHKRRQSRLVSELQGVKVTGNSIFQNPDVESVKDTASDSGTIAGLAAAAAAAASTLASAPPQHPQPAYTDRFADMSGTEEDREAVQHRIINEEYKIWKKNSVFLYDIMYSRALDWPTLTTQWLPDVKEQPGKSARQHRLILGTHTSGGIQNYLQIAHINLPHPPAMAMADYNPSNEELGGHGAAKEPIVFSVVQKITHPGEVNKARYQPQNPNLIATLAPDKNVYIWDRSKHSSLPSSDVKPQATLKGHTAEGFALEWNPFVEGQLITGSEDKTVRLWDVPRDFVRENPTITTARIFEQHSAVVNDVQYHPMHGKNLFGSVSDDLTMCLMDTRVGENDKPRIKFENVCIVQWGLQTSTDASCSGTHRCHQHIILSPQARQAIRDGFGRQDHWYLRFTFPQPWQNPQSGGPQRRHHQSGLASHGFGNHRVQLRRPTNYLLGSLQRWCGADAGRRRGKLFGW